MQHPLQPLFVPRSLAVVGASNRPGSLGNAVFRNIAEGAYRGAVYAVNPKHAEVGASACVAALSDVGQPIDLAVVVSPSRTVPAILREAAAAGVRHAVVLSAGFAEAGPSGQALSEDLRRSARQLGIRVLGPNCLGLMRPGIGLNATFARGGARAGRVALVSQSGAICSAAVDWAHAANVGYSSIISLGEGLDLDFGEVLDFLRQDEETDGILLYVEGVREADKFVAALRATTAVKPVFVLKAGRGSEGAKAAKSHSGALAGSDAVFDAVLRASGAVRLDTYTEFLSVARILAAGRLPRGNRLAILTNGGGAAVIATDCASTHGVAIAQLGPRTLETLNGALPPHWSHADPVDIIGDAPVGRFQVGLRALLEDPQVDGVLTLFCPQIITPAREAAQAIIDTAAGSDKPVLSAWLGEDDAAQGYACMEAAGLPTFNSPEEGVLAFAALARYGRGKHAAPAASGEFAASPSTIDRAFEMGRRVAAAGRDMMTEGESKELLGLFGIACPVAGLARSAGEALRLGGEMGFPLAMKIASPDITHKSDAGGVLLDIRDPQSLERGFNRLLENAAKARPGARIDGVTIEPMVEKRFGRELLVGVARDAVFGQVISFGAGGIAVEVLKDVAIGLPPLDRLQAGELIDRTRICALLAAYRNVPAADRRAIEDVLIKVSVMVCALPWIEEMDINPLVVDEQGATCIDARVKIDAARL
jgi:acetyltransferase